MQQTQPAEKLIQWKQQVIPINQKNRTFRGIHLCLRASPFPRSPPLCPLSLPLPPLQSKTAARLRNAKPGGPAGPGWCIGRRKRKIMKPLRIPSVILLLVFPRTQRRPLIPGPRMSHMRLLPALHPKAPPLSLLRLGLHLPNRANQSQVQMPLKIHQLPPEKEEDPNPPATVNLLLNFLQIFPSQRRLSLGRTEHPVQRSYVPQRIGPARESAAAHPNALSPVTTAQMH